MSLRWIVSALALTATAVTPRLVAAQTPATPSAAPTAESARRAEGFYKEGVGLFREKKWAEAEKVFEEAWALNPTVDVAYNLGTTEFRQGKYREAAEHLSFALRAWPLMEAMSSQRPLAEKRLAEARTFVGALTVSVNVAHAEVLVDGRSVGTAPLAGEVFVEPGAHVLEAKLKGYLGAKEPVQVEKGTAKTIELKLAAITPMEASSGVTSDAAKPKGGGVGSTESAVGDGGLRKKLIIAGIASSAVAITGGVVFAIVANAKATAEDNQRADLVLQGNGTNQCLEAPLPGGCKQLESSIAAHDTFTNLSVWSFVLGGALGVGTAVYALVAPKPTPTGTLRAMPTASREGVGVVVVGRW
jgi:hypothetical protein